MLLLAIDSIFKHTVGFKLGSTSLALSNSVRLFCLKLPRLVKLDVAVYFQSVVKIKSLYTLTPAPLASTKLKLVQCECIANGEKPTRWVVIGLI